MAGPGPVRFRLRFDLRRAWSSNRRSWRCHVAFGDEPLGLHRHRPIGGHTTEGGGISGKDEKEYVEESVLQDAPQDDSIASMHQYNLYQYSLRTRRQVGRPRWSGQEASNGSLGDHLPSRGMEEGVTAQRWIISSRGYNANAVSSIPSASWHVPSRACSNVSNQSTLGNEPPFPCHPEQLRSDWLTELLHEAGVISSQVSVSGFTSRRMGEGVGLLSLLHRLELQYSMDPGPTAPKTLVAKFGHPSPEVRRMAQANGSYEREVGLYTLLGRSPQGAATGKPKLSLRTPAVYFCSFHSPSGQMAVIMEDLAGIRHLDQIKGATLAQAIAVVRDTALSHAQHWDSPELDRQAWLPKLNEERFKAFDPGEYPASWPKFLNLFGGMVPCSAKQTLEDLPLYCPALLDRLGAHPRTLLHGDLRLDNVYEVHDGQPSSEIGTESSSSRLDDAIWQQAVTSAESPSLLYMDFGDCCAGRGPADVAYFLSQSLHSDLRRKHGMRLLRSYWSILTGGIGWRAGPSPVTGYSWEACLEDYRTAVLYYWVLAVNVSAHVGEGKEDSRVKQLAEAMSRRSLSAMLDLKCLDIVKGLESK